MPEYLAPGVYVEEIEMGPRPIEGVSTSTAGFVGMTVRGAETGPPELITSFADFERKFGGYLPASLGNNRFLPYAVSGFFDNGGRRLYVKRVPGAGAVAATELVVPKGGLITRLVDGAVGTTPAAGATAPPATLKLRSLRGVQVTTPAMTLELTQTREGVTKTQTGLPITGYDDAAGTVTVNPGPTSDFDARFTTVTLSGGNPATPVRVAARDKGKWGDDIRVEIHHVSQGVAEVRPPLLGTSATATTFAVVPLTTTQGFYPGAIVEFDRGNTKVNGKVKEVSGSTIVLTTATALAAANSLSPDKTGFKTTARTCEFRIVASYGRITEDIGPLTLDDATPFFFVDRIKAESTLIAAQGASTTTANPTLLPSAADGLVDVLAGGSDGTTPGDTDYVGQDNGPGQRSGIRALEDIDQISIVAAPGITAQSVQNALISHCENLMDRFAVLDPAYARATALADVQRQRKLYDTKYAALYFPRLVVDDPVTDTEIWVPPSGHMAGIYARTDIERGVHKAPANVVPRSVTGLDVMVTRREQEILNPEKINIVRDFRADNRGFRVWGARCLTSESPWIYINVRRLFIFLEESLDEGTQGFVFEPNDEKLWARVRQTVSIFLTRVWRDGALFGSTPEEAFFVRCDETTMSPDDILNGRLIMEIGVAPVRPAEFVVIRIGQFPGGTAIEEL